MKNGRILVLDLFAGPGGLGEGFASCISPDGNHPFKIGVSVEKDPGAHKTLTTRAFFRQIRNDEQGLKDYYCYVRGKLTREELFNIYPEQAKNAVEETLSGPKTLGEENDVIHQRIRELKENHRGPVVLIGGPPCQAYSLAGRSRNAGNANYKAEEDHRHFLYKEYLEVLALAEPEIFVMENVRGILSAKVGGKYIFPQILDDLRQPGVMTESPCGHKYRIYSLVENTQDLLGDYADTSDFLIKAEDYGVPQARHRVILLGVRDDIQARPETLQKAPAPLTVGQAIGDLPLLRSGFSKRQDEPSSWEGVITQHAERLKTILGFRFTDEQIARLDLTPHQNLPRSAHRFTNKRSRAKLPDSLAQWLFDEQLDFVANHETRGHIEPDLLRYAFCAAFTSLEGRSPKSVDFPESLAPEHANWHTGKHADRFRTQYRDRYSTTVTSHISKDGHYFIHYDPKQCRSLTVREAARLQTFPDNYLFEGNRTQQYVQVGNAVPPFLAQQIGKVVMGLLNRNG